MNLKFTKLDLGKEQDVEFVARIHCEAPGEWVADHSFTEESVKQTIERLKNIEKVHQAFLTRNADNKIVGFHWVQLESRPETTVGHVLSLWVHPDYRKKGVATRLKTQAESWMRSKGVSEVRTQVYLENQKMMALNNKLGFETVMVGMSKKLV